MSLFVSLQQDKFSERKCHVFFDLVSTISTSMLNIDHISQLSACQPKKQDIAGLGTSHFHHSSPPTSSSPVPAI